MEDKSNFSEDELKEMNGFVNKSFLEASRKILGLPALTDEQLKNIKIPEGFDSFRSPFHVNCRCEIPDLEQFKDLPILENPDGSIIGNVEDVKVEGNRVIGKINLSPEVEKELRQFNWTSNTEGHKYPSKTVDELIEEMEKFKRELFEKHKLKKSDLFPEPDKAPYWLEDEFIVTNFIVSKLLRKDQFSIYPADASEMIFRYGIFIPGYDYKKMDYSKKYKEVIIVISQEDAEGLKDEMAH